VNVFQLSHSSLNLFYSVSSIDFPAQNIPNQDSYFSDFFSFSDVGQMRRWSNGDVPCRASVHLSSEFEVEEHPCNVVPINTSIKIHWL